MHRGVIIVYGSMPLFFSLHILSLIIARNGFDIFSSSNFLSKKPDFFVGKYCFLTSKNIHRQTLTYKNPTFFSQQLFKEAGLNNILLHSFLVNFPHLQRKKQFFCLAVEGGGGKPPYPLSGLTFHQYCQEGKGDRSHCTSVQELAGLQGQDLKYK